MAGQWTKVAADLDSNPKIRKAGRDGREVFLFALRKNAQQDFNGCVPTIHFESWYLADQLMMDEVTASNGLSRAVTAGLLTPTDEGYLVSGWDDEWAKRPLTTAERQERFRQKHKTNKSVDESVTTGNDAIVTGNASNASEKSREEEKRPEKKREEKKASAAPPGGQAAVDAFHDYFVRSHDGEKPDWGGRSIKRMHELVRTHGGEVVLRRIANLESAPPQWPPQPWDLSTFCQHFDKCASPSRKPPAPTGASLVDRQLADIARMEREEAESHDQH